MSWRGPVLTLLGVLVLLWLTEGPLVTASAGTLLLILVFYSTVSGGFGPGALSAILVTAFYTWRAIDAGSLYSTGAAALERVVILGAVAPVLVLLLAGRLRRLVTRERAAREAAERALAGESETFALLEAVLAAAPTAIAIVDPALRFVRVNPVQARMDGQPVEAHPGRTVREVVPDWADVLEPLLRQVLESGAPLEGLEFQGQVGGEERHALTSLYPIGGAGGKIRWIGAITMDITARSQAEAERAAMMQALEESEARFRALAESGVLGVLVADPERVVEANDAFLRLIGYTRDELQRGEIRWAEITPPEYAAVDLAGIETLYRTGVCPPYEKEYIRKDGTRVPILLGGAVTQRDPPEWACFVLDVTERRRAEDALARRDAELRLVIDAVPARIGYIDRLERYQFVNRAYEDWFQRPREAILGRTVREIQGDVIYREIAGYMARALAGEPVRYETIVAGRTPDERILDVRYVPDRAPDGTVRGFVALVTDMTERVRAEQERRNFASLVENSRDFIAVTAPDSRLLYLNPAGRALLGLTPESAVADLEIGQCWEPVCRPDVARAAEQAREGGHSAEFEGRLLGPDEEPVDLATSVFPLRDPRSGAAVAVAWVGRDVRAQRSAEANFRRAQRIESIGLLAGGIAHNFNNMLMAVLGYNEYVLRGLPAESPLRRDAEEVHRAAGRAAELTRQLLAFSQRQILREEPIELQAVVAEIERMLKPLLGAHIELVTRVGPKLHPVRADRSQIEQVIVNLALNARDAMPAGGRLTIELHNVHIDGDYTDSHPGVPIPNGDYVQLAVTDTGQGIDAATRARLFEPFFTTKGPGRGTGLGLAMVYGTVKQSGGFIWVYSEPGLGSTFKIYLPRSRSEQSRRLNGELPPIVGGTETVLVVEDEEAVRSLAARALAVSGYHVLQAADASTALNLLAKHDGPIHLLLTDIIMPGMGGKDLAVRALAHRPGIGVIYMSGYTADDLVTRGLREAGSPFIQKPFAAEALLRLTRSVLDATAAAPD